MSKKNKVFSLIPAVLGLLLMVGVLTVFKACGLKDDGTWMRCHKAQNYAAICGAVICVLFLAAAFIKNKIAGTVASVAGIVGGIVAMLIPGMIMPMCMTKTMRCYTVMQPFVRIMSVLIILFGIMNTVLLLKRKEG